MTQPSCSVRRKSTAAPSYRQHNRFLDGRLGRLHPPHCPAANLPIQPQLPPHLPRLRRTPGHVLLLTANVTAPAGTLHEAVLRPGRQLATTVVGRRHERRSRSLRRSPTPTAHLTTIERISYESSTVEVGVTPDDALDGHILDFIELDGTVSLSLNVANATVDSVRTTR